MRGTSQAAFTERYRKWCRKNKYNFSSDEAAQIYADAQEQIALMPKDEMTKTIIQQSVDALTAVSRSVEQLRAEMRKLSEQLPEFPVGMAMDGVGDSLVPQLMAELGDVTRFARISKRGSPELRRTLFLVMDGLLKKTGRRTTRCTGLWTGNGPKAGRIWSI